MPDSLLVSGEEADSGPEQGRPLPGAAILASRLAAAPARLDAGLAPRWEAQMGQTFTVVIREPSSRRWYWLRSTTCSAGSAIHPWCRARPIAPNSQLAGDFR